MAKSANLYVRIEPEVKEQAEKILSALGIPASNAINMFYKQIILQRGLPFEVKIPEKTSCRHQYVFNRGTSRRIGERICGYESGTDQRRKNCIC